MRSIKENELNSMSDRELSQKLLLSQLYANKKLASIHNWIYFFGFLIILGLIVFIISALIGMMNI